MWVNKSDGFDEWREKRFASVTEPKGIKKRTGQKSVLAASDVLLWL